jgi:putative peptidoglycan lipid II flippase
VPPPPGPSFRQTERSWLIPTVIVVLVAIALGVAGILIGRSGAGDLLGDVRDAIGGRSAASPVAITRASAFDPPCSASACSPGQRGGDGRENGDDAPLAIDGDAQTAWRSEGYDNRDITLLKPGVGLVLELEAAKELTHVEVESPNNGWKALVYVAPSDPGDLPGWGEPVAVTDALAAGTSKIDLDGATGGAVLLWIVDRGEAAGRAPAEIAEVRIAGR